MNRRSDDHAEYNVSSAHREATQHRKPGPWLPRTAALLVFLAGALGLQAGPFAPPAGQPGSAAIAYNSPVFRAWATGYTEIVRGPMQISNPGGGQASFGLAANALGAASNDVYAVVSLGDGGRMTLTFANPILNGPGYDFAVFENSFNDTFLEIGFVEVSSDGTNFHRFAAVSVVQTDTQIGGFGSVDTTEIHNFAGKYRVGFGTPFDLEELSGRPGLDLNAITHVRVVDAVGCIQDAYATYDSTGRKVNDPWPTPFTSSGFDLDGVGVIHQAGQTASFTGTNGWRAEVYYTNPHLPTAPLVSFDWDATGMLFYTTGDEHWGMNHAAYRFVGISPEAIYTTSDRFAGASMTVIGDYAYYNNSDRYNNQYIRKYGPLNGTPVESAVSSTANYSLHGHNGALFISGADASWQAYIYYSGLNASGDLVNDPAVIISVPLPNASGPIAFDADGNMYYADGYAYSGDPGIYKWTAAEVAAAVANPSSSPLNPSGHLWATITGGFAGATGMAVAPEGLILTATSFTAPSQVQCYTIAPDGTNSGMTVIATTPNRAETVRVRGGSVYVSDPAGIARLFRAPAPQRPRGTIIMIR